MLSKRLQQESDFLSVRAHRMTDGLKRFRTYQYYFKQIFLILNLSSWSIYNKAIRPVVKSRELGYTWWILQLLSLAVNDKIAVRSRHFLFSMMGQHDSNYIFGVQALTIVVVQACASVKFQKNNQISILMPSFIEAGDHINQNWG